jgi:hypothetical protein
VDGAGPIDVPADATSLAIEILVLHEGPTVQSAVLSGPVVVASAAPGDATQLELAVDADTPPTNLASRSTSASTLLVSTGVRGEPLVLDLSASSRLLPPDRLDAASRAIRQILFDTFMSPPADLAGAAGPLTKLAVWGATLRKQLKSGTGGFHDDDPWIHVVSFGDARVPFELIYTHRMPDRDDEVPVCDTALAGATDCTAGCPDRGRSDRVCPFGFWGDEQGRRASRPRRQPDACDGAGATQGRGDVRGSGRHVDEGRRRGRIGEPEDRRRSVRRGPEGSVPARQLVGRARRRSGHRASRRDRARDPTR